MQKVADKIYFFYIYLFYWLLSILWKVYGLKLSRQHSITLLRDKERTMNCKTSFISDQEVDNEFEEDSIEGLGMENGQLNSTLSRGKNKVP